MDVDEYEDIANHVIVADTAGSNISQYVVGTYRFVRCGWAMRCGGFYSAYEFDIARLLRRSGEIVEQGRSCVDRDYRTLRVIDLLWQGVAAYILYHNVQILFGCAIFSDGETECIVFRVVLSPSLLPGR